MLSVGGVEMATGGGMLMGGLAMGAASSGGSTASSATGGGGGTRGGVGSTADRFASTVGSAPTGPTINASFFVVGELSDQQSMTIKRGLEDSANRGF